MKHRMTSLVLGLYLFAITTQDINANTYIDVKRDVSACVDEYLTTVKQDGSKAVNFFSRKFLGDSLNDLLESGQGEYLHNQHTIQRLMLLPSRVRRVVEKFVHCGPKAKCEVSLEYISEAGTKSNIVLFYEEANAGACPMIEKIQINFSGKEFR